ncbi:phospholipase D-like domain-containing protein [Sphingomonas crusticola]|uniref:phospholipase D-like domain-containing protein n=1 Tax=Sphingomonas crusticola TaxID=1697973 RepID=UPI000E24C263|nr:phosphatidylserine/phosphatidylglycerophosphate/cardiolipin synthase family protein [Sphingomonas crusticola]
MKTSPHPHAESPSKHFTVDGNRLTLLVAGPERLKALIALIDGAKENLRLLYYIYTDDETGREVRAAMERALERGVAVSLIVDGFGSSAKPDFFKPLQALGADVCHFLPRYGRRYLLRNHQKLALADEHHAIVGGFNVENDYFDEQKGWRDLGICVEGPAAQRLASYFDALAKWTHQAQAPLRDLRHALGRWSNPKGGKACWLLGGPTRRLSPWARTLRSDVGKSRRLDLIAAYFAPTPRMMRAIERVAKRGGEARVITPSKTDHDVAIAAARHTYHRLLSRGVRVFEYQPLKLHTKLFVIDDVVHIGSANFDVRSLFLNLEIMLRVEDKAFADHMRGYFEGELANSREITVDQHRKAGFLTRLRWAAAYYLMAVVDASVTRRLNFGVNQ